MNDDILCPKCSSPMEPVDATVDETGAYVVYRCKKHPDDEIRLKLPED